VSRILLAFYLALATLAVAYPFYKQAYDVSNSELSGVPLIVVGLPWSLLVIEAVDMMRRHVEGVGPLLVMCLPGVLLNACLIYAVSHGHISGLRRPPIPPSDGTSR
jgi:hypothetical protein